MDDFDDLTCEDAGPQASFQPPMPLELWLRDPKLRVDAEAPAPVPDDLAGLCADCLGTGETQRVEVWGRPTPELCPSCDGSGTVCQMCRNAVSFQNTCAGCGR